jgi:hypothetical protein
MIILKVTYESRKIDVKNVSVALLKRKLRKKKRKKKVATLKK